MAECKYCTNYYVNSNERIDNCCFGHGDSRRECFTCNERLKPKVVIDKVIEKDNTKELIKELEKRGYKVTK